MRRVLIGLFNSFLVFGLLLALGTGACGSDDDDDTGEQAEGGSGADTDAGGPGDDTDAGASQQEEPIAADDCPVVVADADCDTSKRPFVFVHGTYGSGDNIANVAMLFGSNGFCQDRFVAVEYNSLGDNPIADLDVLIDRVLDETGADKVELAGHSQGTIHCGTYMSEPERAAKVAHYIGYSGITAAPPEIPTLSMSSDNDLLGENIPVFAAGPNVTQINVGLEDHFAIAASRDAFVETWKFLYDEEPEYDTIQCGQDPVTVEGIAETFGDNVAVAGRMEVYELDYEGHPWERGDPVMELTSDGSGRVGPIELKRNMPYEFKAWDANDNLVGYVYFAPFKRSNRLARFLKPSDNDLIAMFSTDNITRGPNHTALIGRYLGGAFRHDLENSLKINGNEVLTGDNASKAGSVVGFFMYDANENGQSELGAVFGPEAFLVGTDVFVDATEPAWIELEFYDPTNGNDPLTMKVPNWPSSEVLNLLYF